MARLTRPLLVALAFAVATHLAELFLLPVLIMGQVLRVSAAQSGGNTMMFAQRATAAMRTVVRPSPDVFYASCTYDLSAGPVRLETPVIHGTQTIVALYQPNTDNFAVIKDADASANSIVLIIATAGQRAAGDPGTVVSQSVHGLAVVRVLINDERSAAAIDQARRTATCGPLDASGAGK